MKISVNDIVGRISYNCDIFFRVIKIIPEANNLVLLIGDDYRLIVDAPLSDLVIINNEERHRKINRIRASTEELNKTLYRQIEDRYAPIFRDENKQGRFFQLPGKVLHLDGDRSYLETCMKQYKNLGVSVIGIHCDESAMDSKIRELIKTYRPNILVITGHDAYLKTKGEKESLDSYRHSHYFAKTVQKARNLIPHLDDLVIFAGACQSHFESLINAGANFASSPDRVNIHALDPVYLVTKLCYTHFKETAYPSEIIESTLSGAAGLGGVETKGVLRIGMPYKETKQD